MKIAAIIQARMSSSRLPGKVLKEISGKPMLQHVVERVRRSQMVDEVLVATTVEPSDAPLADYCQQNGIAVFRGPLQDVLDRFYQAAKSCRADVVVRITADCPVIDPQLIDDLVRQFLAAQVDFAANRLPPPWKRTYPIGLDTEVCTFSALERAWNEADQPYQREHVMPYLYEQEGRFEILVANYASDLGSQRWTVDTPEDLELIRRVFEAFGGRNDFGWMDVWKLVAEHPELSEINAGVRHKVFNESEQKAAQTRQG